MVSHLLHRLAAEDLIVQREGRWRVAPVGYPAVRKAPAHQGFRVDAI